MIQLWCNAFLLFHYLEFLFYNYWDNPFRWWQRLYYLALLCMNIILVKKVGQGISNHLHILSLTPWIAGWLIIADGCVFAHSTLRASRGLEILDHVLSHWCSFCKFSCGSFLDLTKWWEQMVSIQQPGWAVLSQMTIESFVHWNIKELPSFCHIIRNDNPVGIGTAMTPRIAKLELIEYRSFFLGTLSAHVNKTRCVNI